MTKNFSFTIGTDTTGKPVRMDALTLVDTRLLGCANSGGGKSWMLRRLIEQVGPKVPVIVLDDQGEFSSLREKLDMVLAGREGEVEAHPRSAKLLCRKLVELRVSAVVDLYDLKVQERRRFVRIFLESLLALPRKLWGNTLIVLDEAHKYAPEKGHGQSESTEAVIDLMSQGRKRGFGGVLVSQRLSKIHKDAVGECNNVLLGRFVQDVDLKRAADILGLAPKDRVRLRKLKPGAWYGFGPAFKASDVQQLVVGDVATTHPDPKSRHKFVAPKASAKIRKVLKEFEGLQVEAEKEARTETELRAQVAQLQKELKRKQPAAKPSSVDVKALERRWKQEAAAQTQEAVAEAIARRDQQWESVVGVITHSTVKGLERLTKGVTDACKQRPPRVKMRVLKAKAKKLSREEALRLDEAQEIRAIAALAPTELKGSMKRILSALVLFPDETVSKKRLGTITGLATRGGGFNTATKDLWQAGYMTKSAAGYQITEAGIEALGDDWEFIPEAGNERLDFWRGKLSGSAQKIFDAFRTWGTLTKEEIGEHTGLATRGGGFNTALKQLRDYDLIRGGRGQPWTLNEDLME